MDTRRKLLVAVLGVVLFVALLSGNLALAAERTVLDAGYVTDAAEDRDLYGTLTDDLRDGFEEDTAGGGGDLPGSLSRTALVEAAITEAYVQGQVEANVERLYAYLHGDASDLRLEMDLVPVKENVLAEFDAATADLDLREFDVPRGGAVEEMAASESAFASHRETFRAEQKQRIQAETDEQLSDEELERRLDAGMGEIRDVLYDEMESELDAEFGDGGRDPALEEPARGLLSARIDALTGEADYDEYAGRVDAAKDDLRDAVRSSFESELDEALPDTRDLTEGMDENTRDALDTARGAVTLLDTLVLALPVLALAIVALLLRLSPPSLAALATGVVSTLVGLLGVSGASFASGQVESRLAGAEMAAGVGEFAVGVLTGLTDALTAQSAVLLVVGIALLALGIGIRRGLVLDGLD